MALKKAHTLPEGYTAEYIRFDRVEEWSRSEKKITVIFALFANATVAANSEGRPIKPFAFRLRLNGEKYDQYFANPVLADSDVIAQAYLAAKVEYVDSWAGSAEGLLADAEDV